MAPRDRLSALRLIDKIKQHEIQTIGAELASLRAAEQALEDQSTELRDAALREAMESTEDTRIFLPAYLKSVETLQADLSKERSKAAERSAIAEEKMYASFREAKTTEQVLGNVKKEIALEDARAEAAQMDDAGRALFMMARRGQTPV